jgi:outer membrane protein OmpA-like peptidoglycan-associated protein
MDINKRGLCIISEEQREEYEAEFAQLIELGFNIFFEGSPDTALPMIGKLDPDLIILGTEIEDYEGIELLAMIMNQHKDLEKPVVVLPDKEDGLPPMIHSRSPSTGKSSVEAVSFEQITELFEQAAEEPPAETPTPAPAPSAEPPEVEPVAAAIDAGIPQPAAQAADGPPAETPTPAPAPSEEPPEVEPVAAAIEARIPQPAAQPPPQRRSSTAVLIAVAIGVVVVLVIGGVLFAVHRAGQQMPETADGTELQSTDQAEESPGKVAEDKIAEKEESEAAPTESQETSPTDPPPSSKELVLPIFFGRSKSIPKITDHEKMNSIVESLKQQPTARIVITGHASSEGEAVDNFKVAMERAKNVMQLLVKRGISANRFELKSVGATAPR